MAKSQAPATAEQDKPTTAVSLAEAFLAEQNRCRELLAQYKTIGPAGMFGYACINSILQRADAAVMDGDTVAMLRLYEEMKGCE